MENMVSPAAMFQCRSCHSNNIESIIPLGRLPLANALLHSPANVNEPKHNLEVMLCKVCGLAQLRELVEPKDLFTHYVYFSSNSDTMLESSKLLVERIAKTLSKKSFVIEIASNDGYLLQNYLQYDIPFLGIDPAKNVACVANQQGITTLCEFFNTELAENLLKEGKQADIIHANNVMAHVPNINDFIKGIKILLKPKGRAIIEVPYFMDLIQKLEFDTIYHEHVFYFSVKSLRQAFHRHQLMITDLEKLSIHGGTLRLFITHSGDAIESNIVLKMIQAEEEGGCYQASFYSDFMDKLQHLKYDLHRVLYNAKSQGRKIAAYGASAKGTTLLNYFNIGSQYIDFVVDKSPTKQGLFTPGMRLPIYHPSTLIDQKTDYVLLLTWNFADEIMQQQDHFRRQGGKFIVPIPELKVA